MPAGLVKGKQEADVLAYVAGHPREPVTDRFLAGLERHGRPCYFGRPARYRRGSAQASPQAKNTLIAAKSRYGTWSSSTVRAVSSTAPHMTSGARPSTCYGACARAWPVYYKPRAILAGHGVDPHLIGTVKRSDGRRQPHDTAARPSTTTRRYDRGGSAAQNVRELRRPAVVAPNGSLVPLVSAAMTAESACARPSPRRA